MLIFECNKYHKFILEDKVLNSNIFRNIQSICYLKTRLKIQYTIAVHMKIAAKKLASKLNIHRILKKTF